jgi:hypothetical protein
LGRLALPAVIAGVFFFDMEEMEESQKGKEVPFLIDNLDKY